MEPITIPFPRIRITAVKEHVLQAPLRERFGWSLGWTRTRTVTLVEVSTDAGLTGWGEGRCARELLAGNPEIILGRSPFEVEAIYDELRVPPSAQRRSGAPAAPGLDMAMWDLAGQALGVPVSRLLGRRYRDRIQAYCTALYRKDWPKPALGLAAEALWWKGAGYRAIKMKIGYGPRVDLENVAAVRDAIGADIGLAVDSNCAYDAGTALSLGRGLEQFDLLWWEEPLVADDLAGYARLKEGLRIPLAGGETESVDWLAAHYVQPRLVDILQPDLENVGLTGARRLSWLCWLNHLRLIPHNWGTSLRTAATLHWMSVCPPVTEALAAPAVMFEFDQTENPLRDAVIRDRIAIDPTDGCVKVPDGPGLGVEVLPEAVERYRIDLFAL